MGTWVWEVHGPFDPVNLNVVGFQPVHPEHQGEAGHRGNVQSSQLPVLLETQDQGLGLLSNGT